MPTSIPFASRQVASVSQSAGVVTVVLTGLGNVDLRDSRRSYWRNRGSLSFSAGAVHCRALRLRCVCLGPSAGGPFWSVGFLAAWSIRPRAVNAETQGNQYPQGMADAVYALGEKYSQLVLGYHLGGTVYVFNSDTFERVYHSILCRAR
jgi:hypothetical protein